MKKKKDKDNCPMKTFTCPHCGEVQKRRWPKPSENYCRVCQRPMD